MKKTLMIYFVLILLLYFYCNPSLDDVVEMVNNTAIMTIASYFVLFIQKISPKFQKEMLMDMTRGMFKYFPYVLTVGFTLFCINTFVILIRTRNFILAYSILPMLTSFHASWIVRKMYEK